MNSTLLLHDPTLVAAALAVCLLGCHATFRLADHAMAARGTRRIRRSLAAGSTAGASIWATHFLAMLALSKNMPMDFDIGVTIASIVISMAGCGAATALWMSGRAKWRAVGGGVMLGASTSAMHFVGMAASAMGGDTGYATPGVIASIMAGTALAVSAVLIHRRGGMTGHLVGTLLLASGIGAIHFGSMASMRMDHMTAHGSGSGDGMLAAIIGVVVCALMLLTLSAQRLTDRMDRQEREANVRLAHVASHDTLTGLPNRALLMERLGDMLEHSTRTGTTSTVLFLDLDGFKAVNDQFGHGRGDDALREFAAILDACVRDTDTIGRMGGDEFLILQRDVDEDQARAVCGRILRAMQARYQVSYSDITLGVSIGVATFPTDAREADEIIRMADVALYRAKREGRGIARFFERSMDEAAKEQRAFESDLRMAVARGEMSIMLQPQAGTDERDIRGFEALARWNHPTRGSVPPDHFVPIAERTGSIVVIGDWVLREACREAATWSNPLRIAVNLSAVQIADRSLAGRVSAILEQTGLDPSRLELEVTETALMNDQETALSVLQDIKALGVKIAMDDFGTGYSSLSSLYSFPFDKIKVDKSFVSAIGDDGKASSIVRAIIGLGRSLDMPIVAEGVENEDQLGLLQREHCTEIQGYLIGRPMPAEGWAHVTVPRRQARAA